MPVTFAERALRLEQSGSISPSITISASAGTSQSMVTQRATRTGAPASAPATAISSTSSASFCGPVNNTTGAAPTTIAHGIGVFILRSLTPVLVAARPADATPWPT